MATNLHSISRQASSTRRISAPGVNADRSSAKRTKSICLRLSPEEQELLRQKARQAGVSQTALLRDHLRRTRIYNHKERQQWLAAILSIRKLLIALAERAGAFQPANAAVAIAYLAAIARHLEQLAQYERQHAH